MRAIDSKYLHRLLFSGNLWLDHPYLAQFKTTCYINHCRFFSHQVFVSFTIISSSSSEGDAIKVYLRIRPPGQVENDHSGQILEVRPPNAVVLKAKPDPKVYTFDHVADINTTQV